MATWPLAAALEGPLATILAVWALLRHPAHWRGGGTRPW
jgi:hypothetical protein